MPHEIVFEPVQRRGQFDTDTNLLEAARALGVSLIADCSGLGICARCRVQIISGLVSQVTLVEASELTAAELAAGYRLACMARPLADCQVHIPPESLSGSLRAQIDGQARRGVALEPALRSVHLELTPPVLPHPQADAESVLAGLDASFDMHFDLTVLQTLSTSLRAWNWQCDTLIRDREIIGIGPAGESPLGLAVDLGSTGLAAYLVDLQTGETLAASGMQNPQANYGEDIVSRIGYASQSAAALTRMQQTVVAGINQLVSGLCRDTGVQPQRIYDAVIVGNTAMHHLLLGLPVQQLALAPFVATIRDSLDVKTRDIGLNIAPGAYVHLPPIVAGYVGADHIAVLVSTVDQWRGRTVILLDVGTNTEVSLFTAEGHISSLSCASGPAFEGYQIRHGMRAAPGAVERVSITSSDVHYTTIDDLPPVGICGSGILDGVAQLSHVGVVSDNGHFQPGTHPALRRVNGEWVFVLAEDGTRTIVITQDDIRQVQLAKAAIQTGVQTLLEESGVDMAAVEHVIIAGAFGSYIDIPNAIAMGMLPPLDLARFTQVGNAAGMGAVSLLLSTSERDRARSLHHRIRYIELARYPGFARRFALNCRLGQWSSDSGFM